jgi:Pentapeptide repeats (8 copies)
MTFALIALLIGTGLVYYLSFESDGDQVRISGRLALWMTVQYAAVLLFLIFSFLGLVSFILSAHSDSTPPRQGLQGLTSTKPLPVPGSEESEILEVWGKPDIRGKTWLTYRTTDSTVVFCLEDLEDAALVEKVIVADQRRIPMPSERIAQHIAESLAEGEQQEDFEYMVDMLTQMRRPYHPEASYEEVENVTGWVACLFVPAKPRHYVDAMQKFRILFKGIADSPALQATFANSVLPAALTAGEQLEYRHSLYFSWEPILSRGNLQNANLGGLGLYRADLREADLLEANLLEADLQGADLQEANLLEANLQEANLQGAYLQGAYLRRANLQYAYLQYAYLQGAYLREARGLIDEQLEQAVGNDDTQLPESLSLPAAWWR